MRGLELITPRQHHPQNVAYPAFAKQHSEARVIKQAFLDFRAPAQNSLPQTSKTPDVRSSFLPASHRMRRATSPSLDIRQYSRADHRRGKAFHGVTRTTVDDQFHDERLTTTQTHLTVRGM